MLLPPFSSMRKRRINKEKIFTVSLLNTVLHNGAERA